MFYELKINSEITSDQPRLNWIKLYQLAYPGKVWEHYGISHFTLRKWCKCYELLGEKGLLTQLVKDLTEIALQGKMDAHLQENSLEECGNRRNGFKKKTVKGSGGSFELEVPRDRNSSFEPQIVKTFMSTVLSFKTHKLNIDFQLIYDNYFWSRITSQ